jgi:hypothetical protein
MEKELPQREKRAINKSLFFHSCGAGRVIECVCNFL